MINRDFVGLSARLTGRLKELGLRQVDVCNALGVSRNAMSNYMNNERIPDTVILYNLSIYLSVKMEWLLTGEVDGVISDNEKVYESDEYEFLDKFKSLSKENQKKISGVVDALLEPRFY